MKRGIFLAGGTLALIAYLGHREKTGKPILPGSKSTLYVDSEGRWRTSDHIDALVISYLEGLPNPPNSKERRVMSFFTSIERVGAEFSIEPALIAGIMDRESGGDVSARGAVGEYGLMQVRPTTAQWLGYKGPEDLLSDPDVNLYYAAKYLRYQLDQFSGVPNKVYWAVAGYNAGTPQRENGKFKNQGYVDDVMEKTAGYAYFFNSVYNAYGRPPSGLWR